MASAVRHAPTDPSADRAETLIVGGGAIGIEAAVGLRHAGVDSTIIEAGPIGSTIEWWAPDTTFFSSPERIAIAGVPLVSTDQSKTTRESYLTYLRGVVAQFDVDVRCYRRVVSVRPADGGGFDLTVVPSRHGVGGPEELRRAHGDDGRRGDRRSEAEQWHARRLILAIGDMHRPRLIGVPGEHLPHVSHWFDDPHRSFRQRIVIVGGKNSAVEAALRLHRVGADVTIVHRGARFDERRVKYWLRPEIEWLIEQGHIRFMPNTVVEAIDEQSVMVRPCDEAHGAAGPRRVAADRVFLLTGYSQDPSLFVDAGVELVGPEEAPRHDPETMETNVRNLYVAGTAVAGTQFRAKVYIENSHVHVQRIIRAITGVDVPWIGDPRRAGYATLEES